MGSAASCTAVSSDQEIYQELLANLPSIDDQTLEKLYEIHLAVLDKLKLTHSDHDIEPISTKDLHVSTNNFQYNARKQIVIFCDGTGGSLSAHKPTNVASLYNLISQNISKVNGNATFKYFTGIVTEKNAINAAADFATGLSMDLLIQNIMEYIYNTYDDETGEDELIMFGFSRGSIILRIVSNVLRMFGIPKKDEHPRELLAKFKVACGNVYAEALKASIGNDNLDINSLVNSSVYKRVREEMRFQSNYSSYFMPKIAFLGLFDSVAGFGSDDLIEKYDYFFHLEDADPIVKSVCHIMPENSTVAFPSLSYFDPAQGGTNHSLENLENKDDLSGVTYREYAYREFRQPGDHRNVGGGWLPSPSTEKCLANNTLRLMLQASPFAYLLSELTASNQHPTVSKAEVADFVFSVLNKNNMKTHHAFYVLYNFIENHSSKPAITNTISENIVFAYRLNK